MFGWLAARSFSPCRRAPYAVVSRRARRITPGALMEMLPGLGSVLYLHAPLHSAMPAVLPPGLLVTQRMIVPLLAAHWLAAVSAVTQEGPREWCECIDSRGRTVARWHLLPDTDYLAWEALISGCQASTPMHADTSWLRADRAHVMHFHLRECAGMLLLEQGSSATLSPLGDRIARLIAHAESVMLQ